VIRNWSLIVPRLRSFVAVAFLFMAVGALAQSDVKRPLSHADYDIWNTITGMTLSPDGKWICYTQAAKGDATFVVKNIASGQELKFARGGVAKTTEATEPKGDENCEEEEDQFKGLLAAAGGTGAGISGGPAFTPDSKFLYFVLTPTRAELDKAKADKVAAEAMARAAIAVLELATGKIKERLTGYRSFNILGDGAGTLVLVKEPRPEPKTETKSDVMPMPRVVEKKEVKSEQKNDDDQQPLKQPEPEKLPDPKLGEPPAPRAASDLVIRNLADGKETIFTDVQEHSITKNVQQIVFATSGKNKDNNGVFFADIWAADKAQPLVKGAGRYYRLTWDEKQSRLAFYFDDTAQPATTTSPTDPGATPPTGKTPGAGKGRRIGGQPTGGATTEAPPIPRTKPRVYVWDRPAKDKPFASAVLVVGPDTPGLKSGWQVVDRGRLGFSADGLKLNVSVAPAPEPEKSPAPKKSDAPAGSTDRVELDLWHWKDEVIQPMQKARAAALRSRSFAAAYLFDAKKLVHLADEDYTVRSPEFGDWAIGSSDKKYRGQSWESPIPADYSLVNIRTGESKTLLDAARSALVPSPKGKYVAGFDGKNWFIINAADGKKTVLTAKLPQKFFNEDFDSPQVTPPYGQIGWSSDEKYFLVADRCDIWKFAPDGSEVTNVTKIGAANGIRFRIARVEKPDDDDPDAERDRGLDMKADWLLSAENLRTRDTGFYRLSPGGEPKLLIMGPRSYGTPTKAKKADTMVLPISTFTDYGDYYATTTDFREIKRLTDANPHRAKFNWAKAELVHYTNTDGAKLSGILVKPEDFDPSKKYPMVVYIYERLSQNFHRYAAPSVNRGQVINPIWYASNGYLVLMPDICYKIGYPGQSALQCVLPAIQAVADKAYVDENAIGINGQSWGGYQIAYMVTQTNRFKAAVAGAAVTNMTSAYNGIRWGTGMARQFQYERTQSRIGESLWQAPMKYLENSPVFWADRVRTPVMMINNDQDDAVPWYQGIEFYLSLRRLGKEVYMLNYNGERHNLAQTANARDFALRMHQFFEHHLKGEPMPEWMAKGIPYVDRDKEKEQWKKLLAPERKPSGGE
jgi:dipeptidyl aminopeptidase/acylaminoacyl peptidase